MHEKCMKSAYESDTGNRASEAIRGGHVFTNQVRNISPGGGGGTYPGFGYSLQNRPQELWLSTRSRLEKGGGAVTGPSTLRRGLLEGAHSVGAVDFGVSCPRRASWNSYD